MSFYSKHILPRIVDCGCGGQMFEEQRRRIVPKAKGVVLDLGVGTGLNLPLYDAAQVTRIIGLDPCGSSLAMARKVAGRSDIACEFLQVFGEDIPLEDGSVDTVVLTYTLCTVQDVDAVLREVRRVLRPGGKVLFCEHVSAPTPWIARLQKIVSRPWSFLLGGCQLDRRAATALRGANFRVDANTSRLKGVPLPIAWQTVGNARLLKQNEPQDRSLAGPDARLSI
ncbi:class I SAM-dependent methyltransferase [uncultured Roseibium sp.]|uniref:class I SAM-dependent methyltransferase n=1 Tax=uncultured Roseibium sp. TaxID=1936171 RepID=UPI00261C7E4D|nr:class I SAM-dependent methyltransferase [uncultured Roseibium sp.]